MARARNIKPGLFKNEILGVADPLYTLLFEGLWILADRAGRMEDRPLRIKGEVFPYRDGLDMEAMLCWLVTNGFIQRYAVAGKNYILILEFVKHQSPHRNESESVIPAPEEIGKPSEEIGSTRADCGFLIPDSGLLIADSLIPDSLNSDSLPSDPPPAEDGPPPRKAKPREEPKTGPVWQAYSAAYRGRYHVDPVRNSTVNGQLAQVVNRLGEEAAFVAEFYLTHKNRFYVEKMHPVGLLLSDAEKLRTEWATGRQTTSTQALLADKTQTNLNAFAPLIAEARAKEQRDAERRTA